MGILDKIWAVLGGKGKNINKPLVEWRVENYYPTDHKLSWVERKQCSIKLLRDKGIPVIEHLPGIEDYETARYRDAKEVAGKALVLFGLVAVATAEKSSTEIVEYLQQNDLWKYVSENEKVYLLDDGRSKQSNNEMSWQIERLSVLLWALGCMDSLPWVTETCDFSGYKNMPDMTKPADWVESVQLRSREEILNEADLIYRIHWAGRNAYLKNEPVPAGMNYGVVHERHFALNWLIMYADDWDDVTTDT